MINYYVRLALKSFQRTPALTLVILFSISIGIAVCVVTLTLYHAVSSNPIWWKSARLYVVTMDSWDPKQPYDTTRPSLPPPLLSYRDAKYLLGSTIPERKVAMYRMKGVITGAPRQSIPDAIMTRVTTSDFFSMFDVPFLYGSGWSSEADLSPLPLIVLSRAQNDALFGGINSVGRVIRWNDRDFRIVGVLDRWFPQPKFYDLTSSAFGAPEDAYIPFGWAIALKKYPASTVDCWRMETLKSFEQFLSSDCLWIHMWVELPNIAKRQQMQAFIDSYWDEQHRAGRFPRARNNQLIDVSHWLVDQRVVSDDDRMLVELAFAFLASCIITTAGILLAKFLKSSPISGIRRALGASRLQIFLQHLVEVCLLCICGATFGIALSGLGLWALSLLFRIDPTNVGGYQALIHLDMASIGYAVALAVLTTLAAGIYPAWRICTAPLAVYLKGQ